ncbi:MAG: hypothetical protein M0R17_00975 [Candidatus Omnitrophica bacterium]|nr:hypothetical protein [Candidatus Omnitrophota bacterium]
MSMIDDIDTSISKSHVVKAIAWYLGYEFNLPNYIVQNDNEFDIINPAEDLFILTYSGKLFRNTFKLNTTFDPFTYIVNNFNILELNKIGSHFVNKLKKDLDQDYKYAKIIISIGQIQIESKPDVEQLPTILKIKALKRGYIIHSDIHF